jgi:formylglycine-generating enzyme required for sulfatase activity/cellulose biosynthesis protein BcsQ
MDESETIAVTGRPGPVYTFYSYKGGVGRSMALVNVGVLMALEGHRVLLIDWDLEVPGLETFFLKAAACTIVGTPADTPGVLDLLEACAERNTLSWRKCILTAKFSSTSLDIISAGRKSDNYDKRIHKLNWIALFDDHDVGRYLDSLREEWRRAYDFVLIDSRTGITDIGDICTVLMPDAVVAMFVSSHQNLEGVKAIVDRARSARRKLPVNRNMLMVVPVHGRDESKTEYALSMQWKKIFEREFRFLYKEWLPREIEPSEAAIKLSIPYVPIWSFGERIPVLENRRELQDPTSISSAYLRLATLLSFHLDWYAVFSKADVQELKSAKITLNTTLRENETLKATGRVQQVLVGALALSIVAGLLVWFNYSSLRDQWRWFTVTRPYTQVNILPYVLTAEQERTLKPGDRFRECGGENCPEMIVVPAGKFTMGSPATETGRQSNEGPQHTVTIPRPFATSKFDLTFNDWDACVSVGGCVAVSDSGYGRGTRPVINVSWDDAQQYVTWFSRMTGRPYRLLTEAEWEYAARAGTTTAFYWGDDIGEGNANCKGCGSEWDNRETSPVGSFKPNAFGLYDMAGNVWQWVQDCYHEDYSKAPNDGSAWTVGGDCSSHVDRGGSAFTDPQRLRAAARGRSSSVTRINDLGFRLARTIL